MGFDATALDKYTTIEKIHHAHHAGNSSGIVDGAALVLLGSKEAGLKAGLKPRAKVRMCAVIGSEPDHHADRPHARLPEGAGQGRACRPSDIDLLGNQRGLRHRADEDRAGPGRLARPRQRQRRRHRAWATHWAPPARLILGTAWMSWSAPASATALATLCIGAGMGIATIIERV